MSDSNHAKPGPEPPAADDVFTAADFVKAIEDRKRWLGRVIMRLALNRFAVGRRSPF